jgi:hypothetical protein
MEDTVLELAAAGPDAVLLGPALGTAAEPLLQALWAAFETRHLPVVMVDDGTAPAVAGASNVRARLAPPFEFAAVAEALSPAPAPAAPSGLAASPRWPAAPVRPRTPSADRDPMPSARGPGWPGARPSPALPIA